MGQKAREALLISLPASEAERALDDALAERGFERTELTPPQPGASIARSDARFFDVDLLQPSLSIVREWNGYSDATRWNAALELAKGLPPAARMEMALPPALSVLARALSRRAAVVGFAVREVPWHLVSVAFQHGRAIDVITWVKDRLVMGADGEIRRGERHEARSHLDRWLAPHTESQTAVDSVLGERDLPSTWRVTYLHS